MSFAVAAAVSHCKKQEKALLSPREPKNTVNVSKPANIKTFTHISWLKAKENMPMAPQHPMYVTVWEKWSHREAILEEPCNKCEYKHYTSAKHVCCSLQHVNKVHFIKNDQHLHSLTSPPSLPSPSPVSSCSVVSPQCWTAGTCLSLCFPSTSSLSSTSFALAQTTPISRTTQPRHRGRWSPTAPSSLQ